MPGAFRLGRNPAALALNMPTLMTALSWIGATIGGLAALAAVIFPIVAAAVKYYVKNRLQKDVEEYKANLKLSADRELAHLSADLERQASTFNRTDEFLLESIREVLPLCYWALDELIVFVEITGWDLGNVEEKERPPFYLASDKVQDALDDAYLALRRHRVGLPLEIADDLAQWLIDGKEQKRKFLTGQLIHYRGIKSKRPAGDSDVRAHDMCVDAQRASREELSGRLRDLELRCRAVQDDRLQAQSEAT